MGVLSRILGGPEGDPSRAEQSKPKRRSPEQPWAWITLLGLFLLLLILSLVYLLIEIWPAVQATENAGSTEIEFIATDASIHLSREGALLVLALVAGALGSLLHATISFGDYVGNQTFRARWIWWYLMRAPAGALLAFIFYFAIRAGFLTSNQTSENVNEYGIATFSGLAGLFAKQALDKLEEVFNTFFGSKDAARADSLTNPQPVITEIDPERFAKLSAEVLVIRGRGFTERSKVRVARAGETEGRLLEGQLVYLSPEELRVTVHEKAIAETGVLYVTVVNPEPGGGISGPYAVDVTDGDDVEVDGTLVEVDETALTEAEAVEGTDASGTVEPPDAEAVELTVDEVAEESETVEETAELAEQVEEEAAESSDAAPTTPADDEPDEGGTTRKR